MGPTLILLIISVLLLQAGDTAYDPVAELAAKVAGGQASVQFDAKHGYLKSLLDALKIPVSSQTLVFSKTSLQTNKISPTTPRALYFNEDNYVAWVPDASLIEIMSVRPGYGSVFYMLENNRDEPFGFSQSTGHECAICHFARESPTKFVPKLLFDSVIPDRNGGVEGTFPIVTTDRTAMDKRWGGWYVTGNAGSQKHVGNIVLDKAESVPGTAASELAKSSNITDLGDRFDTSRYLTPHSDIVALMVMAHQVEIHNLIALATGRTNVSPQEVGEPLVKALLFSDAAPLTDAVKGTSNYATEFSALGPRDGNGRSLRDFDLRTRLFRYPLSYMIYTEAFEGMPSAVKGYVYRRLREVLGGRDTSKDFSHLSAADRTAILDILRATKPDLVF